MGTSGQIIDTNLIPSNIKNWVGVFGVEWDYVWGIDTNKFVASFSINTNESVFWWFNGVRAIELWNYIYCFMWQQFRRVSSSYEWVALCTCKINKTTLDITNLSNNIYTQTDETNNLHSLNSYVDGTNIYLNRWSWTDRRCYFKIDTLTDIITSSVGETTSGILDNSINKTIWSITYAPTIIISTPVTTNVYSGWTWLIVT